MEGRNEIVLFETKDKAICLPVPIDRDTVWLTQDQMSELFDTARSSIAYHIGKIFKEGELQRDTSVEIFDRSTNNASRPPKYYNLDVIISVGKNFDSRKLKNIPSNIHIYKSVPQLEVLNMADVFVTHGGMNSVSEALGIVG
jgi:hypothetical protein